MTSPTTEALKHLFIVFFYSAVSAIIPILIAYAQNDSRWALLIPIINATWYAVTRYLKEQKLIEESEIGH
ncbi:MAG: hypothetical protein Q8P17_03690 [bacterium]|nr:hypothetical protein [bacterium]